AANLITAHLRHDNIQQYEIGPFRLQLSQSFSAGLRGNDAVSLNRQQIGKKLNVLGRVVDDQYFLWRVHIFRLGGDTRNPGDLRLTPYGFFGAASSLSTSPRKSFKLI